MGEVGATGLRRSSESAIVAERERKRETGHPRHSSLGNLNLISVSSTHPRLARLLLFLLLVMATSRKGPVAPPSVLSWTLSSHKGPVHTAVYNAGSSYLLTGGQDRQIKLWNPNSGAEIKSYSGHGYEVLGIAWYAPARNPLSNRWGADSGGNAAPTTTPSSHLVGETGVSLSGTLSAATRFASSRGMSARSTPSRSTRTRPSSQVVSPSFSAGLCASLLCGGRVRTCIHDGGPALIGSHGRLLLLRRRTFKLYCPPSPRKGKLIFTSPAYQLLGICRSDCGT